jgi:uncharacterized protein DUF4112
MPASEAPCRSINPVTTLPEPEIIPPGQDRAVLTDRNLDRLAGLLDDAFAIPGTPIRFGLDPIVGLIPGLGDILTSLISFLIVLAAWQRGLPMITITRMVVNIAIDTLLGTVPVAGDLFDVFWKSNRMNYNLLLRGQRKRGSQTWRDWAFLIFLCVSAAAILIVPVVTFIILLHWILTGYWGNAR